MIHILTHEYPPSRGGAGRYCHELAKAISEKYGKVMVWAPIGSENCDGIEIIELPWRGSQSWLSSWKLIKKIKSSKQFKQKNEILHIAEPGSSRAMIRFAWLIKMEIKLILTIHGSEIVRFTKNPIEKWFFKRLLSRCTRIHVLSQYNEKKLIELFPFTKKSIMRVPGAPASGVSPKEAIHRHGKGSEKIRIVCVGRIHPRKGQDQIILALLTLPRTLQKQLFVQFVGPATTPKYLEAIRKLGNEFSGRISFEGDCTDEILSSVYRNADIFALTSMPRSNSIEGFGIVYLEASSYGLPVIANRTGGVEDAVIHEKTGLLSEPFDLNSLAKNFQLLIQDITLREKLGNNGLEWAKSHSWNKVASKIYSSI